MTSTALPGNSTCPRCGAGFRCGMVGRSGSVGLAVDCWCLQQPRGLPVPRAPSAPLPAPDKPAAASCFCPACLEQIRHERQRLSTAAD